MTNSTQDLSHTIHDIVLSPTYIQDGIGYAASQAGLFKTKDHGRSWKPTEEPIPVTKLLMTPDLLIAACIGSIAKSM